MSAFTTLSPRIFHATRPRRTALSGCGELEGPIITGPMMSNTFIEASLRAGRNYALNSLRLMVSTMIPMALSPETLQAVPKESWVMYKATMMAQMGPFTSPASGPNTMYRKGSAVHNGFRGARGHHGDAQEGGDEEDHCSQTDGQVIHQAHRGGARR